MKTFLFAALATALLTTAAQAAPVAAYSPFQHRPEVDRDHRLSPREQARYEAEHRHDDRRYDDHFDRNTNYGFDHDHRVSQAERRHWEETHNYGYAQNHRVSPQERAHWEASYRR